MCCLVQGYHKPQGAVMYEYGTMVMSQFAGEYLRKLNEKLLHSEFNHQKIHMKSHKTEV